MKPLFRGKMLSDIQILALIPWHLSYQHSRLIFALSDFILLDALGARHGYHSLVLFPHWKRSIESKGPMDLQAII